MITDMEEENGEIIFRYLVILEEREQKKVELYE